LKIVTSSCFLFCFSFVASIVNYIFYGAPTRDGLRGKGLRWGVFSKFKYKRPVKKLNLVLRPVRMIMIVMIDMSMVLGKTTQRQSVRAVDNHTRLNTCAYTLIKWKAPVTTPRYSSIMRFERERERVTLFVVSKCILLISIVKQDPETEAERERDCVSETSYILFLWVHNFRGKIGKAQQESVENSGKIVSIGKHMKKFFC
jgi:hypothetical protein